MNHKTLRDFTLFAISIGSAALLSAQNYPTIPYKEAESHLDAIVWVEGTVLKTADAPEGVYLLFNANEKYVRVLIPKANVKSFEGSIQHKYTGKKVKAVGKIARYGSRLIVGVSEPKRIKIVEKEPT